MHDDGCWWMKQKFRADSGGPSFFVSQIPPISWMMMDDDGA